MSRGRREDDEEERPGPLEIRLEAKPEGLLRCPFCHDDLPEEAPDWVACRSCLARHHSGCWTELGRCSACGNNRGLTIAGGRPEAPKRGFSMARLYLEGARPAAVRSRGPSLPVVLGTLTASSFGLLGYLVTHEIGIAVVGLVIGAALGWSIFAARLSGPSDAEILERVRRRVREHRVAYEKREAPDPLVIKVREVTPEPSPPPSTKTPSQSRQPKVKPDAPPPLADRTPSRPKVRRVDRDAPERDEPDA